jgi:hypothetical protein
MGQYLVAVSAARYPAILAVVPVPMGARPTMSANPYQRDAPRQAGQRPSCQTLSGIMCHGRIAL